jgi:hypothetical protein
MNEIHQQRSIATIKPENQFKGYNWLLTVRMSEKKSFELRMKLSGRSKAGSEVVTADTSCMTKFFRLRIPWDRSDITL